MRICFVCNSLVGGGAERNVVNVVNYFVKRGIICDIVILKNVIDLRPENANILPLINSGKKIQRLFLPFYLVFVIFKFYLILRARKYSAVIAGLEYLPYYLTAFTTKTVGTKSVLIISNNLLEDMKQMNILKRVLHQTMVKLSLHLSDRIIAISRGLKRDVLNNFRVDEYKLEYICSGVDLFSIRQLAAQKLQKNAQEFFLNGEKYICSMGRLENQKDYPTLFKAFRIVTEKEKQIKLLCIGKGSKENDLKHLANDLGLRDKVIFLGFQKNPFQFIARSRIFVLSSHYEGFANALVEAMASGIPVVSTDSDYGPREILLSSTVKSVHVVLAKYGILVPVKNPEVLAQAIVYLLQNKKMLKKYTKQATSRASAFSVESMGSSYLASIRKLIGEGPKK